MKKQCMKAKPDGFAEKYATAFQEGSVADAYQYRPPYPPTAIEILSTLITDTPRRVLDVGCGTGALTRHLTEMADEIDAIDFSPAMVKRGKQLPNGGNSRINWIVGRVEEGRKLINIKPSVSGQVHSRRMQLTQYLSSPGLGKEGVIDELK